MSNFTLNPGVPHLAVIFKRGPDGGESFGWGATGNIPMLSLIGAITQAQHELPENRQYDDWQCSEPLFVIIWNQAERSLDWFVHPDIPLDPLIGMLETIKLTLVQSWAAQQQMARQPLVLGPDGSPVNFRR
jgi:hypothetical protein